MTTITDKPRLQPVALRCDACATPYDGWLLCGPLDQAVAFLQAITCPSCAAGFRDQVIQSVSNPAP